MRKLHPLGPSLVDVYCNNKRSPLGPSRFNHLRGHSHPCRTRPLSSSSSQYSTPPPSGSSWSHKNCSADLHRCTETALVRSQSACPKWPPWKKSSSFKGSTSFFSSIFLSAADSLEVDLAVVMLLQGPQQLHARDCWSSVNSSSSAQKLSPCQPFGGSPLLHPGERIRDRQLLKRQSTSKNRFRPVSSSSSRANQATAKSLMPFTYHLQAVTQASNSEGQTRKRSSARLPCSWPAQARLPSTTSMRIGSRGSRLPCDQYSSTSSGPKGAACAPRVLSTLPTSRQNALPCLEPVATEICTSICYNEDPCDCRYQIGSLETVIDVLNGLGDWVGLHWVGWVVLWCSFVCVCVVWFCVVLTTLLRPNISALHLTQAPSYKLSCSCTSLLSPPRCGWPQVTIAPDSRRAAKAKSVAWMHWTFLSFSCTWLLSPPRCGSPQVTTAPDSRMAAKALRVAWMCWTFLSCSCTWLLSLP